MTPPLFVLIKVSGNSIIVIINDCPALVSSMICSSSSGYNTKIFPNYNLNRSLMIAILKNHWWSQSWKFQDTFVLIFSIYLSPVQLHLCIRMKGSPHMTELFLFMKNGNNIILFTLCTHLGRIYFDVTYEFSSVCNLMIFFYINFLILF